MKDYKKRRKDKLEKKYELDFQFTYLKMEGKTWDEHMNEITNKNKKMDLMIPLRNKILMGG